MPNSVYAVAVTLLVAVISIVPAMLVGPYVPAVFRSGAQQAVLAAWIAGLACWFMSRSATSREHEAAHEASRRGSGGSKALVVTGALFVAAVGAVVVLHFFGDGLI